MLLMSKLIDITGTVVGAWTVLGVGRKERLPKGSRVFWLCRCKCGTEREIISAVLRSGRSKSCGCETSEAIAASKRDHGETKRGYQSRAYRTWANMINRCTNPKRREWHRYGGRGITVCERWRDFKNFKADMGDPPPGLTLDRINNSGNYEPGNCRWATRKEQTANRG
jgi:hypothetical protein